MTQPPQLAALTPHRPDLVAAMTPWWSAPVADYSAALWRPPPSGAVEPALVEALSDELARVGHSAALPALLRRRVLATAHHVTPTNGPSFLALDAILTASGEHGIVAAYSGVAFSNAAWSGALSFAGDPASVLLPGTATWRRFQRAARDRARDAGSTEHRVSLIPSRWRDGLLYRHPLPADLPQRLADLTPAARACLPGAAEDWPTWALSACASIQQSALGARLTYFDLNRAVAGYLIRILPQPAHPLRRLLLDPEVRTAMSARTMMPWFYATRVRKGAEKIDLLRPTKGWLSGRGGGQIPMTEGALIEALESSQICPGLLLCFAALGILNPFRCLGSFNQITYQSRFAESLSVLGLARAAPDPGPMLLTGRLVGESGPIYPLDLVASRRAMAAVGHWPMSRLWEPIVARFLP